MDVKELAQKIVDGGNVDELTKGLEPKVQSDVWTEVASKRKAIADKELEVIEGRRKAAQAVTDKGSEAIVQATKDIRNQMRGEQIDIAFGVAEQRLQAQGITLTSDQKSKLKEDFKLFDSGKFDASLIAGDVLKTYAATNAESLLRAASQLASGARSAADYNAGAAAGGSTGEGGQPEGPMSPYVESALKAARKYGIPLTRAEAERAEKVGTDWKRFDGPKAK